MPQVQHIVLVQYKQDTPQEKIDEIFTRLGDLQNEIKGILSYTYGPNSSPENLNQGYSHGFTMVFASPEVRDEYLNNETHQAIGAEILDNSYNILVLDYNFEP